MFIHLFIDFNNLPFNFIFVLNIFSPEHITSCLFHHHSPNLKKTNSVANLCDTSSSQLFLENSRVFLYYSQPAKHHYQKLIASFFCSGANDLLICKTKKALHIENILLLNVCSQGAGRLTYKRVFDTSLLFRGPEEQTRDEGPQGNVGLSGHVDC